MYKLCSTEQSASRQQILEQSLLEEMQLRPFEDISISELCVKADIPRRTFYRYFADKQSALDAIIDHFLLTFDRLLLAESEGKIFDRQRLTLFYRYCHENERLLRAMEVSGLWDRMTARLGSRYCGDFQSSLQYLSVPEYACAFLSAGVISVARAWYLNGFSAAPEQLADSILQSARMILRASSPERS